MRRRIDRKVGGIGDLGHMGQEMRWSGQGKNYERFLGDVKDLMRDLRDRNKDMERIMIRDIYTSYEL